jgi:hypothetical protein
MADNLWVNKFLQLYKTYFEDFEVFLLDSVLGYNVYWLKWKITITDIV